MWPGFQIHPGGIPGDGGATSSVNKGSCAFKIRTLTYTGNLNLTYITYKTHVFQQSAPAASIVLRSTSQNQSKIHSPNAGQYFDEPIDCLHSRLVGLSRPRDEQLLAQQHSSYITKDNKQNNNDNKMKRRKYKTTLPLPVHLHGLQLVAHEKKLAALTNALTISRIYNSIPSHLGQTIDSRFML